MTSANYSLSVTSFLILKKATTKNHKIPKSKLKPTTAVKKTPFQTIFVTQLIVKALLEKHTLSLKSKKLEIKTDHTNTLRTANVHNQGV